MSNDPVSRAAAQNAWLREGLEAARRPGDGSGPAADGPVFVSDADRDRAAEALQVAYAEGRLAKDDFDARVGRALTARTHAELAAAASGLPGKAGDARLGRIPAVEGRRLTLLLLAFGMCVAVSAILHRHWPSSAAAFTLEMAFGLAIGVGAFRSARRMMAGR